jgi:hypothetical protein
LQQLQTTRDAALKTVNDKWGAQIGQISEIPLSPTKSSIFSEVFGVAWMPYYRIQNNGQVIEVAAFAK